MGVGRIARGSFSGMLPGSWIWITFLILLNSVVGGVSVVKVRSVVFTGNSGVSAISIIFLILGCDDLSMLLTLGMSVISTTFVTRVLFLVVSNTVGVILLLDLWVSCLFWVGYFGTSFSYFKCYICSLLCQVTGQLLQGCLFKVRFAW